MILFFYILFFWLFFYPYGFGIKNFLHFIFFGGGTTWCSPENKAEREQRKHLSYSVKFYQQLTVKSCHWMPTNTFQGFHLKSPETGAFREASWRACSAQECEGVQHPPGWVLGSAFRGLQCWAPVGTGHFWKCGCSRGINKMLCGKLITFWGCY